MLDFILSPRLLAVQKVTKEQKSNIYKLHNKRVEIFESMAQLNPKIKSHCDLLKMYASFITGIEYELQENWNFDSNPDYHAWWFRAPHCTCGKVGKNGEEIPKDYSPDCVIHGELLEDEI